MATDPNAEAALIEEVCDIILPPVDETHPIMHEVNGAFVVNDEAMDRVRLAYAANRPIVRERATAIIAAVRRAQQP